MLLPSNFNLIIITLFVCLINITSQLTDLLMKLLVHSHHAANSLPLCGFMRKLLLFYNPPGRVLQTCWPAALRWPCCNRSLCFHLFYHNEVSRWLEQACLWSLTDTGHTCTCVCAPKLLLFNKAAADLSVMVMTQHRWYPLYTHADACRFPNGT